MPLQRLRYDAANNLWRPRVGEGSRFPYSPPAQTGSGGTGGGTGTGGTGGGTGTPGYPFPDPLVWNLHLNEQFTGSALDPTRWTASNLTAPVSNNSAVWRSSNIVVANGNLSVLSKNEAFGGYKWQSGNLYSYATQGQPNKYLTPKNYFRAEIRAKCPLEPGFWPAPLWFRPILSGSTTDGEIDLYEGYGNQSARFRSNGTLWNNYTGGGHDTKFVYFDTLTNPVADDWHTWVIEKTPGQIKMWVDESVQSVWSTGSPSWFSTRFENSATRWGMRVTMQLGGPTVGDPTSATRWDAAHSTMNVDYIKVWDYIGG